MGWDDPREIDLRFDSTFIVPEASTHPISISESPQGGVICVCVRYSHSELDEWAARHYRTRVIAPQERRVEPAVSPPSLFEWRLPIERPTVTLLRRYIQTR